MTRRGGWLDFLHGAVTRNVGLKLSSIFIAVVLFSVVHGAEDLRRNVFVGVVAVPPGDAKDLMLVSEIPDRIRLTLSGTRAQLNSINPNDLAPVELKVHDPSQEHYYFSPSDFDLPAGVAITQIAPTSVDLRWVKRAQAPDLVDRPGIDHGAEAIGRALAQHDIQPLLNLRLGERVHAGGRLVQNEDGGIFEQDAGHRHQLTLSHREVAATLTDIGI